MSPRFIDFMRVKGATIGQARAARRARPKARRGIPKKATTAIIKRVLKSQLETKYCTNVQDVPTPVILTGHITPATDAMQMLAPVAIQSGTASSNVREGDSIQPVKATTSGFLYFNNIAGDVGKIVHVKIFMCSPKEIKDYALLPNLQNALLMNGQSANPVPWTAAQAEVQQYLPVAKSLYTVLKTFTFKLTKQPGVPIGASAGDVCNLGGSNDRVAFSYSWKPPTLKYATDASNFPGNHAPVMFAVCYSPGYNYDTDASLTGSVSLSAVNQLWFKDA